MLTISHHPPQPTHKCRARHAVAPKSLIIIIISPLFSIISIVSQMSRAEPSQAAPVTQQVTYVTLPAPLQAAEEATCRPPPPRQVGLWHTFTDGGWIMWQRMFTTRTTNCFPSWRTACKATQLLRFYQLMEQYGARVANLFIRVCKRRCCLFARDGEHKHEKS